jgi:hypothetical protein
VAIFWDADERSRIEDGIARYPAESGHCAALARIVYAVAQPRDERVRGLLVRPVTPARFLAVRAPLRKQWAAHTLVETQEHRVDALTGADGCPAHAYLAVHFLFPETLVVGEVDVSTIDPWIQEEQA